MSRPAIAGLVIGDLLALPVGRRGAAAATAAPLDSARQAKSLPPPDVVRAMAREAYVWGWPLAYVHGCRVRVSLVPAAGRSRGLPVAPVNELAMLTEQAAPRTTLVPCPNRDVLYGFGIFDLAATPVIVQVPDFGERFWLYQLGDQRTDGFAHLGSMYGTRPGCYLVVGPGWAGDIPPGGVRREPRAPSATPRRTSRRKASLIVDRGAEGVRNGPRHHRNARFLEKTCITRSVMYDPRNFP